MSEIDDVLIYEPSTSQCVEVKCEMEEEPLVERKTDDEKKFKCSEPNCEYSTQFNRMLIRHMAVHSTERPHKCDKCDKSYKTKGDLRRHFKLHLDETSFQCNQCKRGFKTASHLKRHKLSHEESYQKANPIGCKLCDFSCKSDREIGKHFLSKHTLVEPLQCNYPNCQYTTHNDRYLKIHKKNAHDLEKRFKCDKCEEAFVTESLLKTHSFTHMKNFVCAICQYSCIRYCELEMHRKYVHVSEPENIYFVKVHVKETENKLNFKNKNNSCKMKKSYKCDKCDSVFHKKFDLKQHSYIHRNIYPFKCDKCDSAFQTKYNLKQHSFIHTNNFPFKCNKCDSVFQKKLDLKQHSYIHRNYYPFKCDKCDSAFQTKYNLRQHLYVHTKNKPFKCEKCQYSCRTKKYLETHTRNKHVYEKKWKCVECGNSYRRQLDLERHKLYHIDAFKQFKCHLCNYSAYKKKYLEMHFRVHQRRYKCDKCYRSYNLEQDLEIHRFIHMKSSKCDQCDYRAENLMNLKQHLIEFHSFSSENSGKKCEQCGLMLRSQSDSREHWDAHRLCYVQLPRLKLSVSPDFVTDAQIPCIPLKIELNINIKNEIF